MKRLIIAIGLALLLAQISSADYDFKERDYTIEFKSGPFMPQEISSYIQYRPHMLIQLADIPTEEEKLQLEEQGIKLLVYMPNYAWFALVTEDAFKNLDNIPVKWIGEILPEYKIKREPVPSYSYDNGYVVRLVQFFPDVSLDDAQVIMEKSSFNVYSEISLANALIVGIPQERLNELASIDEVQYTEIIYGPFAEQLDLSRQRISVNEVQAPPLNLNGSGVKVMIYDGGNIASHPAYNGRVQLVVANFCGYGPHTTAIAGIIGGNGALSVPLGNLRGMATQATMVDHCWSPNLQIWNQTAQLQPNYQNAIQNYQISIASNSWSVDVGPGSNNPDCNLMGDYEAKAFLFDRIVRGDLGKKIQVDFAGGNYNDLYCGTNPFPQPPLFRNYGTVSTPAVSKNVISVGATWDLPNELEPYSSRGPVDDGRIKPDVLAPGGDINTTNMNNAYQQQPPGTSFAVPHVAGSAALLMQLWKSRNNNQEPLPSTIKALFIQGAEDMRNPGPDYEAGYGQINVTTSANLISRTDQNSKYVLENQIRQGETHEYFIRVQNAEDLKATLVWDDKEGTLNANRNLINDLDLKFISPMGSLGLPYVLDPQNPSNNAVVGEDHTNNVEQIILPFAFNGTWKVRVVGTSIPFGPQSYSLVSNMPLLTGANLSSSGVPRVGTTIALNIIDQTNPGNMYVLLMSLTNSGIPLGDGRIIPLGFDPLLLLAIQYPLSIGLQNNVMNLDLQGRGQATWSIPNIPELAGLRVYAAFVVVNPSAPSGIGSISNSLPITLQT